VFFTHSRFGRLDAACALRHRVPPVLPAVRGTAGRRSAAPAPLHAPARPAASAVAPGAENADACVAQTIHSTAANHPRAPVFIVPGVELCKYVHNI
jgi:hypothetical protein